MDALTAAHRLFTDMLWNSPNPGLGYIQGATGERRPVEPTTAGRAGLGYAIPGYSQLLAAWGFTAAAMHEAGLVDAQGLEVYGDRLTFPWLDMAGRTVVGLGGRAVTPRRPKYVNTPEPLFDKGTAVYGLHQAAPYIHATGWALIVEGPFDALALWQMGYPNAVATVGAKVTIDQLTKVLRLTDSVVVLLDADEGGRRGRDALAGALGRHPLPGSATVHTATLLGAKDAGDPQATVAMVGAAITNAITLAHI